MADVISILTIPGNYTAEIPVKAATVIPIGGIFGVDAAGLAVPAATAVLIAGRAVSEADNTDGANGDLSVQAERGVYLLDNSAGDPLDAADILKKVYIEDGHTVKATQAVAEAVAGVFLGFKDDQCIIDTRLAPTL